MDLDTLRDVWRCVTMNFGELSVKTIGTSMMLQLSADNLALNQVNTVKNCIHLVLLYIYAYIILWGEGCKL